MSSIRSRRAVEWRAARRRESVRRAYKRGFNRQGSFTPAKEIPIEIAREEEEEEKAANTIARASRKHMKTKKNRAAVATLAQKRNFGQGPLRNIYKFLEKEEGKVPTYGRKPRVSPRAISRIQTRIRRNEEEATLQASSLDGSLGSSRGIRRRRQSRRRRRKSTRSRRRSSRRRRTCSR